MKIRLSDKPAFGTTTPPPASGRASKDFGVASGWDGVANRIARHLTYLAPDVARRVFDSELSGLLQETFNRTEPTENEFSGASIAPGAVSAPVVTSVAQATALQDQGKDYVFAVDKLDESNVAAILGAAGLVVAQARKSAFAEQFRGLGRPVVAIKPSLLKKLDGVATVDGTRGVVIPAKTEIIAGSNGADLKKALDQLTDRPATFIAESSSPTAIRQSLALGASAIRVDGDAFLQAPGVLASLQRYLLETEAAPKRRLLSALLAEVRSQAEDVFQAADGADVTIALGTRGPKSYFPAGSEELANLASSLGLPIKVLAERVERMGSGNSKLGIRGGRWAVEDPRLFETLGRAMMEAAAEVKDGAASQGKLSLLIPAVSLPGEMAVVRERLESARAEVEADYGQPLDLGYGAGIETAGAALQIDAISQHADFVEYGVEELTETLLGISRDDASTFVPDMVEAGVYPSDPFTAPASRFLDKMMKVGQYTSGDTPFSVPARVRGRLASHPDTLLGAIESGISSFSVPADVVVGTRIHHAQVAESLAHGNNAVLKQPHAKRKGEQKLWDVLSSKVSSPAEIQPSPIPEGVTALEHVEDLIRKVASKQVSVEEAILSLPADIVESLRRPTIDPEAKVSTLQSAVGASPGCGIGRLALSHEKAEEYESAGEPYVLLVNEVHAEDVPAVRKAEGLVSVRGGKTSHSAVIAANSDVPCVMDEAARVDLESRQAKIGKTMVAEGDWISIDGTKGNIIAGKAPLIDPSASPAFGTVMDWADEHRTLGVQANADTPYEAIRAFEAGASGVGLVRSEHMFFGQNRLTAFRAAVLGTGKHADDARQEIEDFQAKDFEALFAAAAGKPVTVRLLDPPLHEFLPHHAEAIAELAAELELPVAEVEERISESREVDSLMGLRGSRLGLVRQDIEAAQVRSLARAYVASRSDGAPDMTVRLTVPMISNGEEMQAAVARIEATWKDIEAELDTKIPLSIGAMIETPSAALDAARIAEHVDYFSYGTNDLTQMTLGFGRNVAPQFVPALIAAGALSDDPSTQLNPETVGKMMQVAEGMGRHTKQTLKSGICGAQGSDPKSVALVHALGLDYVSVPPSQVPKARLAAARAAVAAERSMLSPVDAKEAAIDAKASQVARLLKALPSIPVASEQRGLLDQLKFWTTELKRELKDQKPVELNRQWPALQTQFEAETLIDRMLISDEITAEIQLVDAALQWPSFIFSSLQEDKHLAATKESLNAFHEMCNQPGERTSGSERQQASHIWSALRSLEAARVEVLKSAPIPERTWTKRLRHRNDTWDNQYYTQTRPEKGEAMGSYLKKISQAFLQDNNLRIKTSGFDAIPDDRPVVFAVSHRSGAIDRFISMNSLPFGEDDFMYMVREGSPLDIVAQEAYGEDNCIVAAKKLAETSATIKEGFESGKRFLLTYPEGTGTLVGESRYVAMGVALMALEADAVVVPVTIHDSFDATEGDGGTVAVIAETPIDISGDESLEALSLTDKASLIRGCVQLAFNQAFAER